MHAETSEFEKLRTHLDETESKLRPQLDPAIRRLRAAEAELANLLDGEKRSLEEAKEQLATIQGCVDARSDEVEALTELLRGLNEKPKSIDKSNLNTANSEALRKLDVSTRELATLSKLLRTAEESAHWLREFNKALMFCPSWWRFMPLHWQSRKRSEQLRKKGLFDADAYLRRYPDVAEAGMDPLRHYIAHGQAEGRLR